MMKITKIENETVIDHIEAGKAVEVLNALKLKGAISLAMNVSSSKLGKKDIIKIENKQLDPDMVAEKIRDIAPNATVNWIKDYKVVKKVRLASL